MRRLVSVAVASAVIGAASALWAESIVVGASVKGAYVAPASVGISPHEIMKSGKNLPAETVNDPT
jgi:hypothetical protein